MDAVFGLGVAGVVATTVCIVAAAWLVGAGVHLVLRRAGFPLSGVAFTVGLGLAVVAVAIQTAHLVVGNLFVGLVPVAAASLSWLGVIVVRAVRGDAGCRDALRSLVPSATDWCSGAVVVVGLAPLIRHGLVYSTAFINDFPNYAASAEQWLSEAGVGPEFLERHPDGFGRYQLSRAEREKPAATAVFAFSQVTTGVPGYALLWPITVTSVLLLVGNLATAIRHVFRLPAVAATAAAAVPVFSIVPMSRLHDAQVGQAIAVGFLACLLAATVVTADAHGRRQQALAGATLGIVLAATLGANPTLVLGSAIGWGALVLWLGFRLRRSGSEHADTDPPTGAADLAAWALQTVRRYAGAGLLALALLVPAIPGIRTSIESQVTGLEGYAIPVPSPLAAVGLQLELTDVPSTWQAVIAWAVVGVVLAVLTVALSSSRAYLATVALVAATVANGFVIVAKVGVTNYATHKWEAVVIATTAPFLVARLGALAAERGRSIATYGLVGLAVLSVGLSWRISDDVPVRVTRAEMELADDDLLSSLDVVNVDLGDGYRNTIAAMYVPSEQVVVSGDGYAEPTPPVGDLFVLDPRTAAVFTTDVTPLAPNVVLAELDLTVEPDTPVRFDTDHPESSRFLYGYWYDPEPSGVWSTRRNNRLVFDVPTELRGEAVTVTIRGARLATFDRPREVIIRLDDLDGDIVAREEFTEPVLRDITVDLDPSVVDAADGRIVLHLETPSSILAAELGYPDDRVLAFRLEQLSISVAR